MPALRGAGWYEKMGTMIPQQVLLSRLCEVVAADDRLVAAMLYGSFALGEWDEFSDLDVMLFFKEAALPTIDHQAWVSQIAPVALYFVNEFGNGATIFENLVRAEFHFDPASRMAALAQWQGTVWFPSLDDVILLDRTGELRRQLQPLTGPPPLHATAAGVTQLVSSLINWTLFGSNVLARGEAARALEILNLVLDALLRMARLLEGQTGHWITPTRAAESELSATAYARLVACTAPLDNAALWAAYHAAWAWGREMMRELSLRFGLPLPHSLINNLDARLMTYASRFPEEE